jgi:uncharacterized protein (UPF0548 family)
VLRTAFVFGRADDDALVAHAERARDLPFSYEVVGVTRDLSGGGINGFRVDRDGVDLGSDPEMFDAASDGLRQWVAHRGAGLRVTPADAPIATGVSIVVGITLPVLTVVAPCRIVWTVNEADRFGFAYGTLAGHPESGEESFVVAQTATGIRFEVTAVSRPAGVVARSGAPVVARTIRRRTSRRYLSALVDDVATSVR